MYFFFQIDFSTKPQYWKHLHPPVKEKLGELLCSLTYHPAKNTLTINILKAKNLKAKDINGKSGEYLAGDPDSFFAIYCWAGFTITLMAVVIL